jgi:hypothetical protein
VVKILDLGLALFRERSTSGGATSFTGSNTTMMGTVDYMAPEQAIDSHRVDIRADLYGLGCTLYYLLAGQPPFPGGTDAEKLVRHQLRQPPDVRELRAELPEKLAAVVARMLAKEPAQRYGEPAKVAAALAPWGAQALLPTKAAMPISSGARETTPDLSFSPTPPTAAPRGDQTEITSAASAVEPAPLSPRAGGRSWLRLASATIPLVLLIVVVGTWWLSRPPPQQPVVVPPPSTRTMTEEKSPWSGAQVGFPASTPAGSLVRDGNRWTLCGGGKGVGDPADQFYFYFRPWTEDGVLVARLTSITEKSDPEARFGLMVREESSPSLLQNGDFENRSLLGWSWDFGTRVVSGNAHSGNCSAEVLGLNAGFAQTVKRLAPRTTYIITGWAKTTGQTIKFGVKNFGGQDIQEIFTPINSPSWTMKSVTFTTGPDSTSAEVYFWQQEAGTAYVDDVALHEENVPYYFASLTPDHQLTVRMRDAGRGQPRPAPGCEKPVPISLPIWLALVREGDRYRAFHSQNRADWKALGGAVELQLKAPQVGLAGWGSKNGARQSAVFEDVELRPQMGRASGLP